MPVLFGAVAYRIDLAQAHEVEINSWELKKSGSIFVDCPTTACDKSYGLMVPIDSSGDQIEDYKGRLIRVLHSSCPDHPYVIKLND